MIYASLGSRAELQDDDGQNQIAIPLTNPLILSLAVPHSQASLNDFTPHTARYVLWVTVSPTDEGRGDQPETPADQP